MSDLTLKPVVSQNEKGSRGNRIDCKIERFNSTFSDSAKKALVTTAGIAGILTTDKL